MCRNIVFILLMLTSIGNVRGAVFTVTNANTLGAGSFIAALQSANTTPGADEIHFNIPGAGTHKIIISASAYPQYRISDALVIDGYTQPGSTLGNPTVEIDLDSNNYHLEIMCANVEITGLRFEDQPSYALMMGYYAVDTVSYHHISIHHNIFDTGGALVIYDSGKWIRHLSLHDNVAYGGQFLFADVEEGRCYDWEVRDNVLEGAGILVNINVLVNGILDTLRVIGNQCSSSTGQAMAGLQLIVGDPDEQDTSLARHIEILDNVLSIAPDADRLDGFHFIVGSKGDSLAKLEDVKIKGNVLHGNGDGRGVHLYTWHVDTVVAIIRGVEIDSNIIDDLYWGLFIENLGGMPIASEISDISITRNILEGGISTGIMVRPKRWYGVPYIRNVLIEDNEIIGWWADGITLDLSFVDGEDGLPEENLTNLHIHGNHLHDNGGVGIHVVCEDSAFYALSSSIHGIVFSENSIYDNDAMGIAIDSGSGLPFCMLPVPVITGISGTGIPYTVHGTLAGMPNTSYRLEFFSTAAPHPSSFGEGEIFVGSDTILLDGAGLGSFAYSLPGVDLHIRYVAVTATNLSTHNTGCFSNAANDALVSVGPEASESLVKPFPNPFNSVSTIELQTPVDQAVLTIFNVSGQCVRTIHNLSGQTITLQRDGLPSGMYFIRLTANGDLIAASKMIVKD